MEILFFFMAVITALIAFASSLMSIALIIDILRSTYSIFKIIRRYEQFTSYKNTSFNKDISIENNIKSYKIIIAKEILKTIAKIIIVCFLLFFASSMVKTSIFYIELPLEQYKTTIIE